MNKVITIPRGEFVIIPKKEYEEFLELKKMIPIVKPTRLEIRAIERGRKEIKRGKYVEWERIKQELARNRC